MLLVVVVVVILVVVAVAEEVIVPVHFLALGMLFVGCVLLAWLDY